ncbi:hypothetical protein BDI4_190008 [Burkholderia diffusa]|uniref:hypothetical protein n=1 Tax=Burkholderia diffusa TaxID=488732 RepID=UPI001CAD3053|nr:hypothetical protein [Burkholderia diffusa]CAG9245748.1 hypothetical protein BDI4_190008 [Burkholderia diffusa]
MTIGSLNGAKKPATLQGRAWLGGDDNSDGGDDTADSFAAADEEDGDTTTPLGDAQPFVYRPDVPDGDSFDIAARGLSEAQEGECFAEY